MLYGAVLNICTDHKILMFKTLSQQRVCLWQLFLEGYKLTFWYIEGEKNVLADCFSRLPRMSKPSVGKNEFNGTIIAFTKTKVLNYKDNVFYTNKFPELLSNKYICNALTCIDPVTNLVELICINGKTSPHISDDF